MPEWVRALAPAVPGGQDALDLIELAERGGQRRRVGAHGDDVQVLHALRAAPGRAGEQRVGAAIGQALDEGVADLYRQRQQQPRGRAVVQLVAHLVK